MEEELTYADVVFRNAARPPEEKSEDATVYSTVASATSPAPKAEVEAAAPSQCVCVSLACLGVVSALLVSSVTAVIYISVTMEEQRATFSSALGNLTSQNQQLTAESRFLQNQTEQLSRDREDLSWTLDVIFKFGTFRVTDYCSDKKCQPCRRGWVRRQDSCYLFYVNYVWKTWEQSREYCRDRDADLVVINDLPEQEFISNHSESYYDRFHGYWVGLQPSGSGDGWVWIGGRPDTLRFWLNLDQVGRPDWYGMVMPGREATVSWEWAAGTMRNRFICECDALRWPRRFLL